jgi:tripartite-type tricarboxylate transporter receptor subunit TctC
MTEEEVAYWDDVIRRMVRTDAWKNILKEKSVESFYKDSEETRLFLEKKSWVYRELVRDLGT